MGIIAGLCKLFVITLTQVTSILYNNALCTLNTEILMNTAFLLCLNNLVRKYIRRILRNYFRNGYIS